MDNPIPGYSAEPTVPVSQKVLNFAFNHFPKITADTLEWLAIVVLHCVTVPTMMAMMAGLTDRAPSLDMVLFVWTGLVLMFIRAVLLRNMFNVVTNGAGFIAQATALAFILFK
jgi:hypothetical protein